MILFGLFILVSIGGAIFFLFGRKQFDFVSAGFFGCIVYFGPGFYGSVFNPYYTRQLPMEPLSSEVYVVFIAALVGAIVTGLAYNPRPSRNTLKESTMKFTNPAQDIGILIVLLGAFLACMVTGGDALFSPDKSDVLETRDRFTIFFFTVTQITLVLFVIQGKYLQSVTPLMLMAFIMFLGFRSPLAISVVCLFTWLAYSRGVMTYAKARYFVIALISASFLISYKFVYSPIKEGRWDIVWYTLTQSNFLSSAFLRSEPFLTQSILNEAILRDLSVPLQSFFFGLLSFFPFAGFLFPDLGVLSEFNVQESLFPGLQYGVASNIYANFYALFGPLGIALFIIIQNTLLVFASAFLKRTNGFLKLSILIVGAFLAFYVHRNSIVYTATSLNRILLVSFVLFLVARMMAIFQLRDSGWASNSTSRLTER